MMSPHESRCIQCGTLIDASNMDATFGRCTACFERSDSTTISSRSPLDALVRVSYRPPTFDDQLATWDTLLTVDGSLTQSISRMDGQIHRRQVEQRKATINAHELEAIRSALRGLDRAGLREMRSIVDMDDVERIRVTAFELNFTESVALYSMEKFADEEGMSDVALSGLRSFRLLWDTIDSVSPYTIRQHYA